MKSLSITLELSKSFFLLGSICLIIFSCKENDEFDTHQSGTFTDKRDKHVYNWVRIGDQIWMKENLAYMPEVIRPYWTDSHYNQPKYALYYPGNDIDQARASPRYNTYGPLYNWPAAQKSCPEGWELPSEFQWKQLFQFIKNEMGLLDYSYAGKYLKSKGINQQNTGLWEQSFKEFEGTDDFGFQAIPGGAIDVGDGFWGFSLFSENYHGCYWSRLTKDTSSVSVIIFSYDSPELSENRYDDNFYKSFFYNSIRCIKK